MSLEELYKRRAAELRKDCPPPAIDDAALERARSLMQDIDEAYKKIQTLNASAVEAIKERHEKDRKDIDDNYPMSEGLEEWLESMYADKATLLTALDLAHEQHALDICAARAELDEAHERIADLADDYRLTEFYALQAELHSLRSAHICRTHSDPSQDDSGEMPQECQLHREIRIDRDYYKNHGENTLALLAKVEGERDALRDLIKPILFDEHCKPKRGAWMGKERCAALAELLEGEK